MNILTYLTEYKAKKALLDNLDKEVKSMKEELEKYTKEKYKPDAKGKYTFTCGQYTVSITPCKRDDIDKKSLESDYPDIAKKYTKTIEYNRTIVK